MPAMRREGSGYSVSSYLSERDRERHDGFVIQMNCTVSRYRPIEIAKHFGTSCKNTKELKIEIAKYLEHDGEQFSEIYDLCHDNHVLNNSFMYNCLRRDDHYIRFQLKSKKDDLWYLQHQKQRFNLLIFGFVRRMEKEYTTNMPIYITQICEKYMIFIDESVSFCLRF